MKSKSAEKVKQAVFEFLETGRNLFGKKVFDDWLSNIENTQHKENNHRDFDETHLEQQIKSRIDQKLFSSETNVHSKSIITERRHAGILYKVAVSVAILIAVTSISFYLDSQLHVFTKNAIANLEVRKVPYGKKQKIKLSDGTEVTLNSGTEFRFPKKFSTNKREVYLKGEAFFNVARNESKPFIIHSGDIQTTVLGTSFNVNAFPEEESIEVTVVSGKVKVAKTSGTDSVFLTPDQAAFYSNSNKNLSKYKTAAAQRISWKNNVLDFNNQSLQDIAIVMERWYDVEIEFENPDLINCFCTGRHENPNLHTVLRSLCYATNIEYSVDNRTIKLKGTCQ